MLLGAAALARYALAAKPGALVPVEAAGLCLLSVDLRYANGQPVARALVSASPIARNIGGWLVAAGAVTAETDAGGRAQLQLRAGGTDYLWRVHAALAGRRVLDVEARAPEGAAQLRAVAQAVRLH